MRIVASAIDLSANHVFEARQQVKERLQVNVRPVQQDEFKRSHEVRHDTDKLIRLLQRYFEKSERGENTDKLAAKIDRLVRRIEAEQRDQEPTREVQVRYRRTERYQEAEALSFRATGTVLTDDGRQIDFAQALDLARVYARSERVTVRLDAQLQPGQSTGVVNAEPQARTAPAAPAPAPTTRDALAVAGGVLGLDQNGDGLIDPTSEFVGGSGNGFAELAKYDDDGNGFIDEGDRVFARLAVVNTGAGGPVATTLASKGVGAIYLDSVASPYTFRDSSGQVSGQLGRSGVYLNENGTSGIAQQVNVVI